LAASLLLTAGVVGGGWSYLARQRSARLLATTQVVSEALAEAARLRGQAQESAAGDLTKWTDALGAARRAQGLLNEGEADDALQKRVAVVLADLERERATAEQRASEVERDRKLLEELEAIRGNMADHWDSKRTDLEYQGAFRELGIDPEKLGPEEAGRRIAERSAAIELASFVDDWAHVRRLARGMGDPSSLLLLATAKVADPDPWRNEVRGQFAGKNPELLHQLANDEKRLTAQPVMSLVILAMAVLDQGDRNQSRALLQRARRAKPDDLWVNFSLALAEIDAASFEKPEEAVRFLTAATSIRPRSPTAHSNLGGALFHQGKLDAAIAEFRTALRLNPDLADAHCNLGAALRMQGKLDEPTAEFRTALRLGPENAFAHSNLADALLAQGNLDEAVAELRKARRLAEANSVYFHQVERRLVVAERQAAIASRLPAVLRGEDQPKNASEQLEFGSLCLNLKRFSASARLFAEAFQADSKLAEDMKAQSRCTAACAAAQAGCGQGKEEPPVDEVAKGRWRKQAINWLKADLAFWSRQVEAGPQQVRGAVALTL
jgi:eukaryotic-like serine/threonine-protein kinase